MTDLLLRLFVKHASDTSDPAVRAGYGRLDQDQNRHGQARQVFHARMAIGMLVVGRAGGQLEPDERHDTHWKEGAS